MPDMIYLVTNTGGGIRQPAFRSRAEADDICDALNECLRKNHDDIKGRYWHVQPCRLEPEA